MNADIEIHVTFELLEALIESKVVNNIVKSMISLKNASFDVVCQRVMWDIFFGLTFYGSM